LSSNSMRKLIFALLLALLLTGCMNTYFNKFGGFPFESQTMIVSDSLPDIKLMVTYRYPYQEEVVDTMSMNMTVNVIVSRKDMESVSIDKLTVAATDGSYLMTIVNPAVYEPNSKFPMRFDIFDADNGKTYSPSQLPSVFTLSKNTAEYEIALDYRVFDEGGVSESFHHSKVINITEIKRRTHYL
jgi:hypothetical protein